MVLYWGARVRADLYMNELPERWASEHNNFKYVPVLSEPLPGDNWSGRTGLVHQAVMKDIADMSGCQVYACGAPVMVEAAHRDFTSRCGLPEEEFFSDAFTPAHQPPALLINADDEFERELRPSERSPTAQLCGSALDGRAPAAAGHLFQLSDG